MISLQDLIKYAGLGAIVFFLVKAFGGEQLDNQNIAMIVIVIIALVYLFMMDKNSACPCQRPLNRMNRRGEHFDAVEPPIVDSIYAEPDIRVPPLENKTESVDFRIPADNEDDDIQDMKNIAGIDKKAYEELK